MRRTVIFAGEAGQGIDRTAVIFGKIVALLGYSCFIYRDYSSLIRGGHNFSIVTFSRDVVRSHDEKADVLVALDEKSVLGHEKVIRKEGMIFAAKDIDLKEGDKHFVNNVLLGMLLKYFSIPKSSGVGILRKEIGESAIRAFEYGYSKDVKGVNLEVLKTGVSLELSDGNHAVAKAALDSGLKMAFYYPMTPATGVFAELERQKREKKILVEQMEDEIAAANAILGANYAGVPAMTGSSGGGIALMSEAVSFAGMAELPAVFYAAQRMGPSTGVPTYTAQGDLKFVLNMAPGEFPRLVLIPGDEEDAYKATREAFYFANKYRIPAFVISDKHIAESYSTHKTLKSTLPRAAVLSEKASDGYQSYAFTKDGISPAIIPGGGQIFRAASYEHDEFGHTTEDPVIIKKMNDKRLRKLETLKKELTKFSGISVYGKGEKIIVFAGSPKGAILDALPMLKGFKAIQINRLAPFPENELAKALKGEFYTVENNATGQLKDIIRENCGVSAKKSFLRYDGRPFTPDDIIKFFK
ncbi:MAG: 2-oxoacid:acceptor oxidoreductase family protein [Parcubacteria group bacterium]